MRTNEVYPCVLSKWGKALSSLCVVLLLGSGCAVKHTKALSTNTEARPAPALASPPRPEAMRIVQPAGEAMPKVDLSNVEWSRASAVIAPLPYQPYVHPTPNPSGESYGRIVENSFLRVEQEPLSTFSLDVDTASYANVRRFLTQNHLPPADAVRIEELVNYFDYAYAPPTSPEQPFNAQIAVAGCPWAEGHRLVRLGIKGWVQPQATRPASNLVFLLDVSGSMADANKLPLVQQSLHLLVNQLDERDRVAIVVYASQSGVLLPPTSCQDKARIFGAIDGLQAGGTTHGSEGIQTAYAEASRAFLEHGVNRVVLATDGDFNVGVTDPKALEQLIAEKAKAGIFLSVLGYGMGNTKDSTMEMLADKGNGNYAYIDSLREANKVLVEQMSGTLMTIASDVKVQVEFNPAKVAAYRLIGYENRMLAAKDFNDDKKDAGEIGAGHTVTALYEIVPPGVEIAAPSVDPLKYQPADKPKPATPPAVHSNELLTLKMRYKQPGKDTSVKQEFPVVDSGLAFDRADEDFKFAAGVAGFGMMLRQSPNKGQLSWDLVSQLAKEGKGPDTAGYRGEFLQLVNQAALLSGRTVPPGAVK